MLNCLSMVSCFVILILLAAVLQVAFLQSYSFAAHLQLWMLQSPKHGTACCSLSDS